MLEESALFFAFAGLTRCGSCTVRDANATSNRVLSWRKTVFSIPPKQLPHESAQSRYAMTGPSPAKQCPHVRTGLEICLDNPPEVLHGAPFGLLTNQASVNRDFRYSCDLLNERLPGQLKAIFSPQHGLWCEQQANMTESPHGYYAPLGLPVFSLYSETRRPTPEMLCGLQCLVIDLQDVGTRVYTFVWTMLECLRASSAAKIPVLVLDRPNPIGGSVAEGPLLNPDYKSFVGGASIPLRHGLTIGELALLLNAEENIGAEVHVVAMEGWRRDLLFDDTNLPWVAPSPNMPRLETAQLYPGQVLLEGTNLSEGRGTTLPFELIGAPFINPHALVAELAERNQPRINVRPVWFVPTFDKWRGERCGGVAVHITSPAEIRSVRFTVDLLATVRRLCPAEFSWLQPPYEYEHEKQPIDILFGSSVLRHALDAADEQLVNVDSLVQLDEQAWWRRVSPFLLYEPERHFL